VVNGPFDYHDRAILHAFVSGLGVEETIQNLADPDQPLTKEGWMREAFETLRIREQECDIAISPFVESAFDRTLLFFTMNHPASVVLKFMAHQVIELIGLPKGLHARMRRSEPLGTTFYPIHGNHHRALGLQFASSGSYRIRGATLEPRRAIKAFFNYYKANPHLVALNVPVDGG
jgi:Polysaccharide biosynthesis enzyme WcbI